MSNLKNNDNGIFDSEIEQLLQTIAEEEGLSDYEIKRSTGSLKGDGYLGVITAVQIRGRDRNGKGEVLDLVVKSAPKAAAVREMLPIVNVFDREIYMYDVVIPKFLKFQIEKKLAPLSSLAKCYRVCKIKGAEALILENLKEKGYSVWERRLSMEDDHVRLVLEEYGRFHGLCYAFRDQNPECFKEITSCMDDMLQVFMRKSNVTKMFINGCTKAQSALDIKTHKKAAKRYSSFKEQIESFCNKMIESVDDYSVVLHGDCWTNNIMFKYEDNIFSNMGYFVIDNLAPLLLIGTLTLAQGTQGTYAMDTTNPNKPTAMCLIDLQLARLGSPVLDLAYFFYVCSSKTVINNWKYYLDVYYRSLSAQIKQLGSDPEALYPYSILLQQWKKFSKFGLMMSTVMIYMMLSEQHEVPDFTTVAESGRQLGDAYDYEISNLNEYYDRIRHMILHFVDNNFI